MPLRVDEHTTDWRPAAGSDVRFILDARRCEITRLR